MGSASRDFDRLVQEQYDRDRNQPGGYVCTTPGCSERLRGICSEPSFCSICLEDLTPILLTPRGQSGA